VYHSPELRLSHNGLSRVPGLLSCLGGPSRCICAAMIADHQSTGSALGTIRSPSNHLPPSGGLVASRLVFVLVLCCAGMCCEKLESAAWRHPEFYDRLAGGIYEPVLRTRCAKVVSTRGPRHFLSVPPGGPCRLALPCTLCGTIVDLRLGAGRAGPMLTLPLRQVVSIQSCPSSGYPYGEVCVSV
jgi:hypothetical protein